MAYCGPRGIPLSQFLEWSQEDQDAALGWSSYEARRCRSCGRHPAEGETHVHVDVCPGCIAVDKANQTDDAKVPGAHTRLVGGSFKSCSRCMTELEMNRPTGQ